MQNARSCAKSGSEYVVPLPSFLGTFSFPFVVIFLLGLSNIRLTPGNFVNLVNPRGDEGRRRNERDRYMLHLQIYFTGN